MPLHSSSTQKKVQSAKNALKIYLLIRFNKHFSYMYFMQGLVKEIHVVNCAYALHASFYSKVLGRAFFHENTYKYVHAYKLFWNTGSLIQKSYPDSQDYDNLEFKFCGLQFLFATRYIWILTIQTLYIYIEIDTYIL